MGRNLGVRLPITPCMDPYRAAARHLCAVASWAYAARVRRVGRAALADAVMLLSVPVGAQVVTPKPPRIRR
jgi:hypothetical protein